jgi:ribonuclease VapC
MIVVDSSAVVAIVRGEPERGDFLSEVRAAGDARISAVNYVESSMVCEGGQGAPGRALFERSFAILEQLGLQVAAADRDLADCARDAFRRYGKGRHPAMLNMGDCFAYALAKTLTAPLLFKGDDFSQTDIQRV